MKRSLTAALALVAALASVAHAQDRGLPRGERQDRVPLRSGMALNANPSAVIATEIAFKRAAQSEGQWTAFRKFAAEGAVMFVPEKVEARQWLKGRDDPPSAARWQPHKVWMSCDGSLAATTGAWQGPDEFFGAFVTMWQRQKKGTYKWVFAHSEPLAQPLEEPDWIEAAVADCTKLAPASSPTAEIPESEASSGRSRDHTLQWLARANPGGQPHVEVRLSKGGRMGMVIGSADRQPEQP